MDNFADRLDDVLSGRLVPEPTEHELRELANLASAVAAVPLAGPSPEVLVRLRERFERATGRPTNPWVDGLLGWLGLGPAPRPFAQRLAAGVVTLAIGGGAAGAASGVSPVEAGQSVLEFMGSAIRNLDPRDSGGAEATPTPDASSSPTATPTTEPSATPDPGEPSPTPGGGDALTPGATANESPQATSEPGQTPTPAPSSTTTEPAGSTATVPATSTPSPDIPDANPTGVPLATATPDDDDDGDDDETPTPGGLETETPDDDEDRTREDEEEDDETPTPDGDDD